MAGISTSCRLFLFILSSLWRRRTFRASFTISSSIDLYISSLSTLTTISGPEISMCPFAENSLWWCLLGLYANSILRRIIRSSCTNNFCILFVTLSFRACVSSRFCPDMIISLLFIFSFRFRASVGSFGFVRLKTSAGLYFCQIYLKER